MKKTVLFFTFSLLFVSLINAKDFNETEISIYNEVTSAFETRFYPGAVEKANELQSEYPDSVFVLPALIKKGEALMHLNNYKDAKVALEDALSKMHTGTDDFDRVYFLLGKVCYLSEDLEYALSNLYTSAKLSLAEENFDIYAKALFYAGKIYFQKESYNKAIPLFEYAVKNGTYYSQKEYEEALQKLIVAYNKSENLNKTSVLVKKFDQNSLTENTFWVLQLYMAESYELQEDFTSAYDVYVYITENAPAAYGVISLKKAYVIANEKFGIVDSENFEKSIAAMDENPQLKQEFWIRLGVDEYNQKNNEKALEYFDKVSDNGVSIFYKQKIELDSKKSAADVEKELLENEDVILNSGFENIDHSFYSLLLRCKTVQKKWAEIPDLFQKIENPEYDDIYNYISSLYSLNDYSACCVYLGKLESLHTANEKNYKLLELYASCLVRSGSAKKANEVYKMLEDNSFLSETSRLEYAKSLFTTGSYNSALAMSEKCGSPEGNYVAGLCCINLKKWSNAKNYFVSYIKVKSNKQDFNQLALFYKGYAEYCLEQYKDSYASFVRFGMESSSDIGVNYVRSAYEYAAKSALQLGEYKNAAIQADNVVKSSITTEDRQNAILFSSEVNSDYGNYEQAISILVPYTKQTGDFAVKALFQIAKIYVKQNKLSLADEIYVNIYSSYAGTELAEEAMYRSGEIYYSAGDYANAEGRLNKYIYKYVSGRFTESALFYCGDSCLRLGENEKCIMMNTTLVKKFPESIYLYGSYKNLMSAYYDTADYAAALNCAKYLVQNFSTQAASDEVGTKLKQLEKIVSGTDRHVVETYAKYEKLGKATTKDGRKVGTELVQLYAKSDDTMTMAYSLAKELLELQKDSSEKYDAATNAEFIADCDRANNENKKAAEMYLLAAEYYRSSSETDTKAAVALYGAVEAFVAQGMTADAKETANLLVQLYPDSKQAKNVRRLVP